MSALCLPAFAADTMQDPTRNDPGDYHAVQLVCTRCHTTSRIMHSRSWAEWVDVLSRMSSFGAQGTDAQWDAISSFLQRELTLLNVNDAPIEEIEAVLNVNADTAAAIISHRDTQKFTSMDQLAAFPGVDKQRLADIATRVKF